MTLWKLGCRWGSNTPSFYDFIKSEGLVIGWEDKVYSINDWLLITDGHDVLAFAKVLNTPQSSLNFPLYQEDFKKLQIPFVEKLTVANAKWIELEQEDKFSYKLQQGIVVVRSSETINRFNALLVKYTNGMFKESILKLLKSKKQMVLQGPPGTGKTRLAKEIAKELLSENISKSFNKNAIKNNHKLITEDDINSFVTPGLEIKSPGGNRIYTVQENDIEKKIVRLKRESGSADTTSYKSIILAVKDRLWERPLKQNNDRRSAALAEYLNYEKNIKQLPTDYLKNEDNFKLLQFHPSYTYEDFVRGIVAEARGENVEYKNVNKVFGEFAEKSLENFNLSREDNYEATIVKWIDRKFEDFKNEIEKDIEQQDVLLSGNIGIFKVENDSFRYGKDWATPSRINFKDFKILVKLIVDKTVELSNQQIPKENSIHAHYRYTYYNALLNQFFKKYNFDEQIEKQELKNYVLILDEFNRANLSSVLGELIYALEYRGEAVESMYSVDGSNKLTIPPNLYIIGTMNTADRSVGHIDYAIRRRFAFVDILPKDLTGDDTVIFDNSLFGQVKTLFTTDNYNTRSAYLSQEFEPKDVALGHSYFIDKSDEGYSMEMRLEYEIKPILLEYVRDGVLKETALEQINNLSVGKS